MQGIHIKNASGKTGSLVNGDLNLEDTVVDISKIVTTDVSEAALGKMGKNFTENATFTGIDNKIVMPGIVTALQLEVGDVIVFSNALEQNNKPRTVESITDNNTIIVNYEHCGSRGNGSLKLTDETVVGASVKLLAKWFVAAKGLGKEAVNTTAFRAMNANHVNNTGSELTVLLTGLSLTVSYIYIDTFPIFPLRHNAEGLASDGDAFTLLVPKGSSWRLATTDRPNIYKVVELR